MKKLLLISVLSLFSANIFAQSYNEDNTILANYLKRMYTNSKFEGVKIVEDYDNKYLISVVNLEKAKYQKESDMFRVAQVKALRQASEFVNGSTISADAIIRTTENSAGGEVTIETVEKIRTVGFVQGMELLINFVPSDETQMVFIYLKMIESNAKKSKKK